MLFSSSKTNTKASASSSVFQVPLSNQPSETAERYFPSCPGHHSKAAIISRHYLFVHLMAGTEV